MGTLLRDVRYALRVLGQQPGFTAAAVLAVALGVGANTTIFSAFDVLLLRPFSFRQPERVLLVWEQNQQSGFMRGSVAPANFYDLRAQVKSLDHLSAFYDTSFNLSEGDKPERIEGTVASAALFRAVEARPALGRLYTEEEEQWGKDKVVVLSHALWQRRFGSDPQVVGRQLNFNGQSYTVLGVMPPKFGFPPNGGELWKPLSFDAEEARNRGSHFMRVAGRLKDGTTPEEAKAELAGLARQLQQQYPDTNAGRGFGVVSIVADYTRGARAGLVVLMAAVGFVLLLACANVANLLLVRAASRQKEIAIRMAMGASRTRLVRQLLTESVVLALAGGGLGALLAVWGVALMSGGIPQSLSKYLPGWENIGVNPRALVFTLAVSLATGLLFGLAPAWQATRASFTDALKEGGRTSGGGTRNRLRSLLVVSEITLSLVLLIGAGLLIRSFVRLMRVEPGFDSSNVVVMNLSLAGERYEKPRARIDFYQQLLRKIETLPGVTHAGAVNLIPLSRSNADSSFTIEGRPPLPKGQEVVADWRAASPGYLAAMNVPLRRGRFLDARDDREEAPRALLVSERFAARFFPGEDPLGRRLDFGEAREKGYWEIVGVVGDVKRDGMDEEIEPAVYAPYAKSPWRTMTVVVKTANDPVQIVAAVQNELRGIDRDQPVFNVQTMDRVVHESLAPQRVTTVLMGVFALVALALATIGIYAVMSYAVAQRTHEIGVRMALGAQRADILRMIVRQGMVLTFVGLALGLGASLVVTRGMTKILYGVTATDPATFVGISLLLAAVAFAANYFPARRATRVDPMVALRHE
ncbi:MAG TPA: ABC transporter permease [Pyrinomonadaceae bacterium]|jgi:putative ABC transport system permease protein|nr:ABC transporter permease [Pyrinomonadaceae bacterium]